MAKFEVATRREAQVHFDGILAAGSELEAAVGVARAAPRGRALGWAESVALVEAMGASERAQEHLVELQAAVARLRRVARSAPVTRATSDRVGDLAARAQVAANRAEQLAASLADLSGEAQSTAICVDYVGSSSVCVDFGATDDGGDDEPGPDLIPSPKRADSPHNSGPSFWLGCLVGHQADVNATDADDDAYSSNPFAC